MDRRARHRHLHISERRKVVRKVPIIVAIAQDGSGTIRQFASGEGIARLLADPDVSQALSDAVTEAAPPTYQLDMEPWLARMLASITPKKALPGYAPGVLAHATTCRRRRSARDDSSRSGLGPDPRQRRGCGRNGDWQSARAGCQALDAEGLDSRWARSTSATRLLAPMDAPTT